MVVVHLAGMRNYWNRISFGQGRDFAGLRNAAHPVGIELDVIERVSFQQVSESVKRELMFAARDRNSSAGFQLGITVDVFGNYGLFQPAKIKCLKQRQHAL